MASGAITRSSCLWPTPGSRCSLRNRSGNRPSHEGVIPYFDKAIALCRRAGFRDILLRGDTDFALTTAFDRWTDASVRFVFGYDATATMVLWGETAPPALYDTLVRRAERAMKTRPRQRYITNDRDLSCTEVVREARQRCDQENLIAQLKGGVRALHAPVNTLHANWAYMVMAALAWSLKAWVALWLPIAPRWRQRHAEEQRRLLRMDFRTFLGAFINVPCQVLTQGRRVIYRLLAWNPWQYIFFRFVDAT